MALDGGEGSGAQGQGGGGGKDDGGGAHGHGLALQATKSRDGFGSGGSGGGIPLQGPGDDATATGGEPRAAAIAASCVPRARDEGGLAGAAGIGAASTARAPSGGTSGGIEAQGQGDGDAANIAAPQLGGASRGVPVQRDGSQGNRRGMMHVQLGGGVPATASAIAGSGGGGAAGAAAVRRPSLLYESNKVEDHVKYRRLGALQNYLNCFIRMAGDTPHLHPILNLHYRLGQLTDLLQAGNLSKATSYFMASISGNSLRNVTSPHADTDRLKSRIDNIQQAIFQGKPIEEQGNVALKINDYMRFHFPGPIRHPWQGASPFWRFALRLGTQPSRHPIFRCLLCQEVVDKGSFQAKLQKHLNDECRGMTHYALELLRDAEKSVSQQKKIVSSQRNKESAHKRPAITTVISEDQSKPTKIARTQLAGPSASKGPADLDTMVADGSGTDTRMANLGYALLESLSSILSQESAEKLETALEIINESTNEVIRWQEAMKAKAHLLDILLSTDVTKEKFKGLSNHFDSIIAQSQNQPPSGQLDAQPRHLKLPPNSDQGALFNINDDQLLKLMDSQGMESVALTSAPPAALTLVPHAASTSAPHEASERIVIEVATSSYDSLWDNIKE